VNSERACKGWRKSWLAAARKRLLAALARSAASFSRPAPRWLPAPGSPADPGFRQGFGHGCAVRITWRRSHWAPKTDSRLSRTPSEPISRSLLCQLASATSCGMMATRRRSESRVPGTSRISRPLPLARPLSGIRSAARPANRVFPAWRPRMVELVLRSVGRQEAMISPRLIGQNRIEIVGQAVGPAEILHVGRFDGGKGNAGKAVV
jgi:hypothetical protein